MVNLKILFGIAAIAFMATFDDSTSVEAIIRAPYVRDIRYTRARHFPWASSIIMLNNMHSSLSVCPNGMPTCRKHGRNTAFKIDCHATLITRKFAVTSRHCFCHKGRDVAYTSGFNAIIGWNGRHGLPIKVKRTFVNRKCEFSCGFPGTHNACDYAVVELARHVPRRVRPVGVWDAKLDSELHRELLMLGYGSTGVVGKKKCAAAKPDGRLRSASFKVISTGPKGDQWGKDRHSVLRYKMGSKKGFLGRTGLSRLAPPGLAGNSDDGIPAFKIHRGRPYLAGVHAFRTRNFRNMINPCATGAQDEFTRLSNKKTRSWLLKVLRGKTDTKLYQPLLHKHRRHLDQLPLRPPGSHQFPYRAQNGHRRRRHVPVKDVLKWKLPGVNKCRLVADKLMKPLRRKIDLEVCGGMAPDKWPLEFFKPGFAKSIAPILKMQNLAFQWNNTANAFVALKKNPYHKKEKTMAQMVTQTRLSLLNSVKSHFVRVVLKAGKKKKFAARKKRLQARFAFRALIPLEKRVKELKAKVANRREIKSKASTKGNKKKELNMKKRAALKLLKQAATPRGRWKFERQRKLKNKVVIPFRKQLSLRKLEPKIFELHRSMRATKHGLKNFWAVTKNRDAYPRPMASHTGYRIRSKRFNAEKIAKWKIQQKHYNKLRTHYNRKYNVYRAAKKQICTKKCTGACAKRCKQVTRLVKTYRSMYMRYNYLYKPFERAIRNMKKLIWTPSSVARRDRRYSKISQSAQAKRARAQAKWVTKMLKNPTALMKTLKSKSLKKKSSKKKASKKSKKVAPKKGLSRHQTWHRTARKSSRHLSSFSYFTENVSP
jgi:hypothetical protein